MNLIDQRANLRNYKELDEVFDKLEEEKYYVVNDYGELFLEESGKKASLRSLIYALSQKVTTLLGAPKEEPALIDALLRKVVVLDSMIEKAENKRKASLIYKIFGNTISKLFYGNRDKDREMVSNMKYSINWKKENRPPF